MARHPPVLGEAASWRQLWLDRAFDQRPAEFAGSFSRAAAKRADRAAIMQHRWKVLDAAGAIRPFAFSARPTTHMYLGEEPPTEGMSFREEHPDREWVAIVASASAQPVDGLYSSWQMLYVDEALDGGSAKVDLSVLLAPDEQRTAALERVRGMLELARAAWTELDDAWRPLVKLLVRVQNRYLPEVTRRSRTLYDLERGETIDPWPQQVEAFDPHAAAEELGVSADQVTEAYSYLIERGLDRDPRDGLGTLRRARPRSSLGQWRGPARQAQDHFEAAEVLRRFLTDLTGTAPVHPSSWPMDGRQPERRDLNDRGPAARITRDLLQDELVEAGLHPHGVHIVGEGQSEEDIVRRLVSRLLGPRFGEELGFTDLGGAGSADRLSTMVGGFTEYALRTVVIVDREGKMAERVEGLIRQGDLPKEDCLLFKQNLEESNFTNQELLDALVDLAANPPEDRPPVDLQLPLEVAEAAHKTRSRRATSKDKRGFAGVLLDLAEYPEHGPVRISKPEFAESLADRMLDDFQDAWGNQEDLDKLYGRRPLLHFVIGRMLPVLNTRSWR